MEKLLVMKGIGDVVCIPWWLPFSYSIGYGLKDTW